MKILAKNIFAKIVTISTCLILTITISYYVLQKYNIENIPLLISALMLITLIFINLILTYKLFIAPLKIILKEMKCLLTGKRYNKIYTPRTDEIGIIAHFFNEITNSLEKVSVNLKKEKRMSSELDFGRKIQRDLLTQKSPEFEDLTVLVKSKSAAEIGGDSFDFINAKNDNLIMYLGDATGHGVPSGLIMTMIHTLVHTFCDMYDNSYDIITQTNKYLKPLINTAMFMTMTMLRFHKPTKKLYYCGAGHEYLIHYQKNNNKCLVTKAGGIALGMIPDISKLAKETAIDFNEEDILILYSDGITEAKNTAGERFGLKRLTKIIEKTAKDANIETIYHKIADEFAKFTENNIQEDDMSLLIIKNKKEQISEEIKSTIEWNI